MNETLIKNSILKKTVKVRDNINTTPSSNKSVRFHGVEFMIITDDESEKGSFIEQNDNDDPFSDGLNRFEELPGSYKSNISFNTIPANTRINLFRVNTDDNNNSSSNNQPQTLISNDGRLRTIAYPNGTIATRVTKDFTNNPLNIRKWSQSFTKSGSLKPPIYPKNRTLQARSSYNRITTGTLISNRTNSSTSVTSTPSVISLNRQSNNSSTSSTPTNENLNNSLTTPVTSITPLKPLTGTTYSLTTMQSSPNLSLYSYLLQSDTIKKDKDINPSSMRLQTKRLSCDELNVKPFMPRIQQATLPTTTITATSTILNNSSVRLGNSTPLIQSYVHNSAGTTRNFSIRNTISLTNNTNASKSTKKGGKIHVNTHNLSFLTSKSAALSDENKLTNLNNNNTEEIMLLITPTTTTSVHTINPV